MKKFLVTFEFRYLDTPTQHGVSHREKTLTVGVFDTFEEACEQGNKVLEQLEEIYPLNPNYNKRERFRQSRNLRLQQTLVSNLAYLKTPFDFYGKVQTLHYLDLHETLVDVHNAVQRYKDYKDQETE